MWSDCACAFQKTDIAKKFAEKLQSNPPAQELSSIKNAVEQQANQIEEEIRNEESQEDSDEQQKVQELRQICKALERRLDGGQSQSNKTGTSRCQCTVL